jgi:hypothetical protein
VHVVPVHEVFLGHGIHCRQFWRTHYHWRDPHYWYFENIEDPNDRGYDALRRVFLCAIAADHNSILGIDKNRGFAAEKSLPPHGTRE